MAHYEMYFCIPSSAFNSAVGDKIKGLYPIVESVNEETEEITYMSAPTWYDIIMAGKVGPPRYSHDKSYVIIGNRGGRVSTSDAGRYYYGSSSTGYNTFSSYTTNLANLSAAYSFNSIRAPFQLFNVSCKGTIQNGTSTGDVCIKMYYSDQDDGTNTYVQNLTLIGTTTVDCAITDTSYDYAINSTVNVPEGKLIWCLVENTGHGSGTEYLYFTHCVFATRHSANWTSS